MSQTVSGEGGGGGVLPNSSNKLLQHPTESSHGTYYSPPGQRGVLYTNAYIPSVSIKSDSPQVENGFHSPASLQQFNIQSSHMNSQYHTMQQHSDVLKGRSEVNSSPYPAQSNPCANVQYFPGGNYVTTVTVNQGEHYQNHVPVQYMQNHQNYYMNTGPAMVSPGNNIKYFQNMMLQQENKINNPSYNSQTSIGLPSETMTNIVSGDTNTSEGTSTGLEVANKNERKIFDGNINVKKNTSKASRNNRKNNSNRSRPTSTSSEAACESSVSEKVNDNSVIKITSNSATNLRTSSSINSVNNSNCLNRPRTNSRCDSVRSETTESSCSSLSSESLSDQNHLNHHSQLAFSTSVKNNNHFGNNHYLNNQVQTINNFNNNMNYQNYMACQARMNQGISKPGIYNNNPNVIQTFQQVNTFQHVQMQSGQVQLMQQQQYPCIQGQNLVRPSVGMSPGNLPQPGPVMQNQDIQNVDHNVVLGQNSPVITNCNSHNNAVPQKLCGNQPHGHFSVMHNPISQHSFPQQRILLNNGMMGVSPDMPVSVLNKPFAGIVVVPFGWKRILQDERVVYVSPSGSELKSCAEVCEYLTQENTCKCGLQCPLRVENVFCFDPKVPHRLTMPDELSSGEATKICNHRRKLAVAFSHHLLNQAKKEDGRKKRKRKSDSIDDLSPSISPHSATFQETPNPIPDDMQQPNQEHNESLEIQRQEMSLTGLSPTTHEQYTETRILQSSTEIQINDQSSLKARLAPPNQERHNHLQLSDDLPKQFNAQGYTLNQTQYQTIESHSEELSKSLHEQRQKAVLKNDEATLKLDNLKKRPATSYYRDSFKTSDQLESQISSSPLKEVESHCLPKSIIACEPLKRDVQQVNTHQKEDLNKQNGSESDEFIQEEVSFSSPNEQTVSEENKKGAQNETMPMPRRPTEILQYGRVVVSQSGVIEESQLNQDEVQQSPSPSLTLGNTRVTNSSALNSLPSNLCQTQLHAGHQFKSHLQQESNVQQSPIQQQNLMQNSMLVQQHQSLPAMHNRTHTPQLQHELATNTAIQTEQDHAQHSQSSEGNAHSQVQFKSLQRQEAQCHISNSDGQIQHQMANPQLLQHHIRIIQAELQHSPQSFHPEVQMQSPNSQIIIQQQQSQGSHSGLPQAHMHLQHQAQHSHMHQQDYENINVAQLQQQQMHRQLNSIQTQMQQQQNTCQTQIVQNCSISQPPQHQGQMQPSIPQPQIQQHSNIHHLQIPHHPNSMQSQVQVQQTSNTPQSMIMQQPSANQTSMQVNAPQPQSHPILSHSGTPHLQIHQSQPGNPHLQMQNLANPHQSHLQIQNHSNASQSQMQPQSANIQSNLLHQQSLPPQMQQQNNISQIQMVQHSNINQNQVGLQHHPMQPSMQLQMSQPQLPVQAQIQGYGQSQQPQFVKQQQNAHTQMQLPICTMQVQGTQNQSPQTPMHQSSIPQQMPNHQFQMQQQQFQLQHSNQQQFQHMQTTSQNRHTQGQMSYHQPQVQMPHMQQMVPMQQHQQQIYQPNQNQNWHPVYGNSRLLVSNGGCQGNSDGFVAQSQSCGAGAQFPCQYTQGCENHNNPCFPTSQTPKIMHPSNRPLPFANMNRPAFCRAPGEAVFRGMIPPQGGCLSQGQMHPPHPMMGGMRPNHPFINNNVMCRMPVHTNHTHMYGNSNQMNSQCPENSLTISDPITGPRISAAPEEGEKRKKGGGGRSRKKAKTVLERNSPCPNVDVRNLITENAISPHTGPGPPFCSTPQPVSLSNDTLVTSTCNASNKLINQGQPVSGPSFMEDPNGYLAQQTALLNSTMSGGAVGQFSPQGPRVSPRPTCSSAQSSQIAPPNGKSFSTRTMSSGNTKASLTPASVMPLPSNVPLPARVSKASMSTSVGNSVTFASTGSTACNTVCSSVQSKSDHSSCTTSASLSPFRGQSWVQAENLPASYSKESPDTLVATAESSNLSHTVTVTYTSSSVTTTTCGSESSSPQSSQDTVQSCLENKIEFCNDVEIDECQRSNSFRNKIVCSTASPTGKITSISKLKNESLKKSDKFNISECISSRRSSSSGLSVEAANKPLTPGPAESTMNTQSPLEMVQNIVSSIPMPSSDELPPLTGRHLPNSQSSQIITDQGHSLHQSLAHHQVLGPQVYNMTNSSGMAGVMYNPNGMAPGMLRGTGPLVVHGGASTGSIPPGVIVSNSGSMVMVTSPFNSKVSIAAPVVCTNVTGINSMVGVQTVPQVQMQSSMVNSHHLRSHLQPIQPVQPVVQLVNTYATMQTPVLIQNGNNLIQSPSGVISSHGGVLGPASIIPNSGPTFVTSQSLLAVDPSSHTSQVQMTQVVTSASGENNDDNCSNRLTPIATPASTPSTPGSSQSSETSPHGSTGGSGRKRKRRRNTSTPQRVHHSTQQASHPPNIMPAIIMGKQIPHHMVMNGAQISHYGNVTVGSNNCPSATTSHMLTATGQPTNSINVVQMVGGHMSSPMPVHLQQPPAIIVPSAAPGLIINQLPDGTFVSTDPSSGVTYPVQLQLSGSHIVGVTPLQNANSTHNIVGSISGPSVTRGTMVAVRQQTSQPNSMINTGAKLLNISPSMTPSQGEALVHNVYGVSASTPVSQSIVCTSANLCSTFPANLSPQQHPNQNTAAAQQPLLVGNGNGTLLQQKTTTIVAQQTTVLATQGGMMGTHSTVSTQTSGVLGESDVSSSDCIANTSTLIEIPISPLHQSAEVTTTRQDEDSASTPESILLTPPPGHSPEAAAKNVVLSVARTASQSIISSNQEPHSASTTDDGFLIEKDSVVWGAHRGHQFWPAQVIHKVGGEAAVRWFGDYQVEMMPLMSISRCPPNSVRKTPTRRSNRGRTALDKAIAEAHELEYKDSFAKNSSRFSAVYFPEDATVSKSFEEPILTLASSKLPGSNRTKKKKKPW